ncbi:MAG: transcriptional regulator, partial [Bacteroidetes bacterium]|nr:transcriptional regulator [Bacteroidota bacterium]
MKKLQMVDLVGQREAIKDDIDSAFTEIMDNAAFINGPYVHQFQADLEKYLDVKNVIPCAN